MSTLAFRDTPGGVELAVKVVPGASRDRVMGVLGDALKIAVTAPPEKGKANQAVIEVLARVLGVKRSGIQIVAGHTQSRKTVRIADLTGAQMLPALGIKPSPAGREDCAR